MLGSYTVEPTALTVRCRIVAVETADVLSMAIEQIPFERLPPARVEALKRQATTPLPLNQQNQPDVEAFSLDFWYATAGTRRHIGQRVKSGTQVDIGAKTEVDAYLYAFTVDADFTVFPVFATLLGDSIFFKAGQIRRQAGKINGAKGIERFYAIARTKPFNYADIQEIVEGEVAYLKSQKDQMSWRPRKTRNLLFPDVAFVQGNFWFEHVGEK
jgi:hypothetical protein